LEKEKAPMNKLLEDIYLAPDEEIFEIKPFTGKMTDFCHMTTKNLVQCPQCGEFTEKATFFGDICRICAYFKK
jgi:formylmethanofuran dehydrogenase subunit E